MVSFFGVTTGFFTVEETAEETVEEAVGFDEGLLPVTLEEVTLELVGFLETTDETLDTWEDTAEDDTFVGDSSKAVGVSGIAVTLVMVSGEKAGTELDLPLK